MHSNMEFRISWYRVCQIFCYLILTGVLNAHTKESDKVTTSGKPDIHGGSNGAKGDVVNNLSKESPRPPTPKTAHLGLNKGEDLVCEDQPDTNCSETGGNCIICALENLEHNCTYGETVTVDCHIKPGIVCQRDKDDTMFKVDIICQYCYQTPLWQQHCNGSAQCNSVAAPRSYYPAWCEVDASVICLGNRRFQRMMPCNWKNGYRWSTAFLLSITLGGFGADRFYLGRWQEGIGKLFSFGGLGLWTIIDIILIGVRYLGPADGSLYVD